MTLLAATALMAQTPFKYPETRREAVVDEYFGTKVADPYRWLEDDNAADTKAWVEAQNKVTRAYLDAIPERGAIKARLTKLWNYERFGVPFKRGGQYFYNRNDGLQNQAVLFVTGDLKDGGRVLLDPNTLSKDGTIALSSISASEDGKLLAYGISVGGSDWITWKVRDVATGKDLEDEIQWSKFSGASWAKDGSGFYYSAYAAPAKGDAMKGVNKNQKVHFHKIGTKQAQDVLVYERPDHPDWGLGAQVTEDGRWLLIHQSEGTENKNRIFLKDLSLPGSAIEPFLDHFDADYSVVGNDGDLFYVSTDKDAPRHKLVAIKRGRPESKDWKTLIAQGKDVLRSVDLIDNRLVVVWMHDANEKVEVFGLDGKKQRNIALPTLGTVGGFSGRRLDKEGFYAFTSFTYPSTVYRFDFTTGKSSVFKRPKVDFKPEAFETKQVFFKSKDGTKIPMFLVSKKGLELDGQNPTLLYGYGGFDISLTPSFGVQTLTWLEMGGVYALANLRGGGEYGSEWHDAGRLQRKQNVFDDFISAAEWLISHKYTSTPKLAIRGGSNGGLLVGACMTQRPDLFGACLPHVGVMDMLRFHKFTIGWAWKSDYGSSETKADFDSLIKYSPLQNLKPGVKYPPTLVFTGDHDDRVVPAHSFKFAAQLQADQSGPAPALIRIETNAGHGAGKPTAKLIDEAADEWAFAAKSLGIKISLNP
ncbi:MAG: S9 family peptidase [Holophagaceae bacterium]|nr:S9 family peptidase [Holophagaceae bacterium]